MRAQNENTSRHHTKKCRIRRTPYRDGESGSTSTLVFVALRDFIPTRRLKNYDIWQTGRGRNGSAYSFSFCFAIVISWQFRGFGQNPSLRARTTHTHSN